MTTEPKNIELDELSESELVAIMERAAKLRYERANKVECVLSDAFKLSNWDALKIASLALRSCHVPEGKRIRATLTGKVWHVEFADAITRTSSTGEPRKKYGYVLVNNKAVAKSTVADWKSKNLTECYKDGTRNK